MLWAGAMIMAIPMEHLPVLFSFFSLCAGLVCLGRLALLYQQDRSRARLAALAFFASFSFMMIVAAWFAYWFTNLDISIAAQTSFAALVFLAMACLELSLAWLLAEHRARALTRRAWIFQGLAAALTALQAPVLLSGLVGDLVWIHILVAFMAFVPSVVISLYQGRNQEAATRRKLGADRVKMALSILVPAILGLYDIWQFYIHVHLDQFISLSLPSIYVQTAWFFSRPDRVQHGTVPGSNKLRLAPALCAGLTAREQEMAALILEGLANKEIAARLGLAENTVRNHIYNLYQKLGVQKRMDLLALCQNEDPGAKP